MFDPLLYDRENKVVFTLRLSHLVGFWLVCLRSTTSQKAEREKNCWWILVTSIRFCQVDLRPSMFKLVVFIQNVVVMVLKFKANSFSRVSSWKFSNFYFCVWVDIFFNFFIFIKLVLHIKLNEYSNLLDFLFSMIKGCVFFFSFMLSVFRY